MPFLVNAIGGKDAEIVDYAKTISGASPEEAKAYVKAAAVVLGAIGRPEAVGPMVQALDSADNDVTRAVVARELTKLPSTPESQKAFMAAFDKIAPAALMPPTGQNARAQLMEAASHFYDPQLVPWLLKQIKGAKGSDNDKDAVQLAALVTAHQAHEQGAGRGRESGGRQRGHADRKRRARALATDVVNGCGDNVACYVSKVQEPMAQEEKTQFMGIKAAYMLAILGNAGHQHGNRQAAAQGEERRRALLGRLGHRSPDPGPTGAGRRRAAEDRRREQGQGRSQHDAGRRAGEGDRLSIARA